MSTQSENPLDDVFFPVPAPGTESLTALEAKLRNGLAAGSDIDEEMIEGLRLFILARHYQGRTESEVEDELIRWGLEPSFTIELASSTLRAGGDVEVIEELRVNGRLVADWHNPHAAEKRNARRSARRRAEARRLAGLEVEDAPVDLGFQPQDLPPPTRRRRPWRMILVVVFAVLVVTALCAGVAKLFSS